RISHHFISCGGQVATALATCARLGLRAKFIGVTGTDDNAKRVRRDLEERGVDLSDVVIRDVPNQYAVILVDEHSGERIVLWDRDERLRFRPRELPPELFSAARVVHVDDVDIDAALRAAEASRAAGTPVTSDIDRLTDRTMDLVKAVTFPMFAEHVPTALTGITEPGGALRALRRILDRQDTLLCVTLGVHGAMALDGDRLHHVPRIVRRGHRSARAGEDVEVVRVVAVRGDERVIPFADDDEIAVAHRHRVVVPPIRRVDAVEAVAVRMAKAEVVDLFEIGFD